MFCDCWHNPPKLIVIMSLVADGDPDRRGLAACIEGTGHNSVEDLLKSNKTVPANLTRGSSAAFKTVVKAAATAAKQATAAAKVRRAC